MNQEIINSIYYLLPELTLALSIIIITSASLFFKETISRYIHIAGLTIAFTLVIFRLYSEPQILFSGMLVVDHFASFSKLLIIFSSLIITLVLYNRAESTGTGTLNLLITLGAICCVSSSNLIMLLASLEVINISIYILLSPFKKISLKYFVYSAVSSGLMLYGITLLYGITGSIDYYQISKFLSANEFNELTLTISIIMIIAGLGFRMLLFPFNFILPSISENISIRKLSLITIIPVITCIAVITRLLLTIFFDVNSFIIDNSTYRLIQSVKWQTMIAVISAASIITGSLVILWQRNLKKIFSFILIAQAGFLLIPLSVPSPAGTLSILLNLLIFTVNSLGLAICLNIITEKIKPSTGNDITIDNLKGLGKNSPQLFTGMIIFLISIAGFPITSGFTGKLYIFSVLFTGGYAWAGILSIMSSLIFLYFIFKLASVIFSGTKPLKAIEIETIHRILLLFLILSSIIFGLYPTQVLELCKYCSQIFGI